MLKFEFPMFKNFSIRAIALAFALACVGCASVPTGENLKKLVTAEFSEKDSRLKVVDVRSQIDANVRDAQKKEVSGSLVEESTFSPSSVALLKSVMCEKNCDFYLSREWTLERFDIFLSGGRKMGAFGGTPVYAPIPGNPAAAAVGLLLGHGLVSLLGSNGTIDTTVKISLSAGGKKYDGNFDVNGQASRFSQETLRTAVWVALGQLELAVKNYDESQIENLMPPLEDKYSKPVAN